MKRFISILLMTILLDSAFSLILDVGKSTQTVIRERELGADPEFVSIIKKMLPENISPNVEAVQEDDSTTLYINGDRTAYIKISTTNKEGKEHTINFDNRLEKALLQLSNIDLSNESSDDYLSIKEKYVTAFVKSSEAIIDNDKTLESTIYEIAADLAIPNLTYNPELNEFKESSASAVSNSPDSAQDNSKNQVVLVVEFKDKPNFEVILHSNYFSSSFFVNIRTRAYLESELKKLVNEAYKHAKRMIRFNTSNQESITHNIDCKSVKTALLKINEGFNLVTDNDPAGDGKSVTYTVGDGHSLGYDCLDGDFVSVSAWYQRKKDNAESEASAKKEFLQGFMKSSLYDLTPVIESFFDDIFLHAIRAFGIPEPVLNVAERRVKKVRA